MELQEQVRLLSSVSEITVFNLKLGQKVEKGQLLAKLDNVQSRLSYEQALAQLNSAESQMNTAKLSLNRVRSLYEKESASLSDLEAAKNSFKTANQGYEATKRGVAIQQEQVRFGYLYAPEDGVISMVNTERDEKDAIIAACLQRFRPIILATFTTVLGLIPLYVSGGEMWEGMAVSIMVGLLFGTIITLIFIPSFYSILFKVNYKNYVFNEKLLRD